MIDKCKKLIGLLILIAAAVISVYLVRMYYPEFYYHTITSPWQVMWTVWRITFHPSGTELFL